jgi:hypothetical protein
MSTFRAAFIGFVVAAIVLMLGDARRGDSAVSGPNHVETTYTIPAGGSSAPLTLPVSNSPVTVNLSVVSGTDVGTSSAVLTYSTTEGALSWSGHCPNSGMSGGAVMGGTMTVGFNSPFMPLNDVGSVELGVSTALNKIAVFNGVNAQVKVVVEMVY